MSTPNEPENRRSSSADGGPQGTPKGGVVPPWQRGTGGVSRPDSGPGEGQGGRPNGPRPPGPPPRGVVSSGTAAASMSGQQAPITKLDDSPAPARGPVDDGDRFVESATRNIDRSDLPADALPDLDEIHHVQDREAATKVRSAPAQVGRPGVAAGAAAGRPLRASVQVRRIDPWATFKISAVLAVAGFIIWMIAVAVLYLVLDGMGVWDQLNTSFGTFVSANGSSAEGDIMGPGTIFGWAVLLGAVNAILMTALATIGAYIYNLCADLIGGAEITLADLD